jgi:hypothetical protein
MMENKLSNGVDSLKEYKYKFFWKGCYTFSQKVSASNVWSVPSFENGHNKRAMMMMMIDQLETNKMGLIDLLLSYQ